jgi:hypothetical protein
MRPLNGSFQTLGISKYAAVAASEKLTVYKPKIGVYS